MNMINYCLTYKILDYEKKFLESNPIYNWCVRPAPDLFEAG